jgi:hypothetical protein
MATTPLRMLVPSGIALDPWDSTPIAASKRSDTDSRPEDRVVGKRIPDLCRPAKSVVEPLRLDMRMLSYSRLSSPPVRSNTALRVPGMAPPRFPLGLVAGSLMMRRVVCRCSAPKNGSATA